MAFLYVNKEKDVSMSETVKMKMVNCHIDTCLGNSFEVCVKANQEKLVKIVVDNPNIRFQADVVSMSSVFF